MKKKKLSILLNIATICLCVCAIAIGVYSVKNASLSVTGTVAFTAHDCKVDVTAYIYGDAVDSSNTASSTGTPRTEANKGTLGTWSGVTDKTGSQTIDSSKSFYFSDMGESGEVEDITIVFTITNQSDFPVKAVIDNATSSTSSITFTDASSLVLASAGTISGTMPAKSNTCNLAIKLKLSDSTKTSNAYSISLSFEKYTPTSLTVSTASNFRQYTSDSAYTTISRSYITMGKLSASSQAEDMRWFVFAQSDSTTGAMKPVTGALSSTTLSAGTYWFISEYALSPRRFCTGNDSYDKSSVRDYLIGEYLTDYSILSSEFYSKITARDLKDDKVERFTQYDTSTFTTINNQSLWLLSVAELYYLNGSKVSITSSICYTNLITTNESGSTEGWWLRSHYDDGDDWGAFGVNSIGIDTWFNPDAVTSFSVRPAFQIVV